MQSGGTPVNCDSESSLLEPNDSLKSQRVFHLKNRSIEATSTSRSASTVQDELEQAGDDVDSSPSTSRELQGNAPDNRSAAASDYEKACALILAGKHDQAVRELSSGLKAPKDGDLEMKMLLLRSLAYCTISKNLRSIPAELSERRAIFAPDPCHLAQLGLQDALGALRFDPDHPEALLRKAQALLLLEKYGEAEGAAQRAQQALLGSERMGEGQAGAELADGVRGVLRECEAAQGETAGAEEGSVGEGEGEAAAIAGGGTPGSGRSDRKRQRLLSRSDDSECILCMKLLYEPVTTPCGHTFCRPCFARAMDHTNRCPMCRTVLHVGRELPVTVTLKALLERSFPEEYEERRQEESGAGGGMGGEGGQEPPIPLFVMSPVLPGEKLALNIFEPRYRLMVRRCMEGSRRFGMATVNSSHQLHPVACECEITECQPLPDGRYYLEIVGRRRFELHNVGEQDGYRVACPQYISDDPVPPDSQQHEELRRLAAEVEELADEWAGQLRSLRQLRRGVADLLERAGEKPSSGNLESLSFWVANLACPLLDESFVKLDFLGTRSTCERFQGCKDVLVQLRDTHSQGCCLM